MNKPPNLRLPMYLIVCRRLALRHSKPAWTRHINLQQILNTQRERERIEVVLNEHGVPGVDKVGGEVPPNLKVTIQSKEPFETTIYRVVEGDGIETVDGCRSKEILVVIGGDVHRVTKCWYLGWSSATSAEESKLVMCAATGTQPSRTHR